MQLFNFGSESLCTPLPRTSPVGGFGGLWYPIQEFLLLGARPALGEPPSCDRSPFSARELFLVPVGLRNVPDLSCLVTERCDFSHTFIYCGSDKSTGRGMGLRLGIKAAVQGCHSNGAQLHVCGGGRESMDGGLDPVSVGGGGDLW